MNNILIDNIEKRDGISIIIPILGNATFPKACLLSIINQDYEGDIQIICIGDKLTDAGIEMLQQLATNDNRTIDIVVAPDGERASFFNSALDIIKHEWIMFNNPSDILKYNAISNLSIPFSCSPDIIVFTKHGVDSTHSDYEYYRSLNKEVRLIDKMRYCIQATIDCKVIKKSLLDRYELRFPNCKYGELAFFNFYYTVSQKAYFTKKNLYTHKKLSPIELMLLGQGDERNVMDYLNVTDVLYEMMMRRNIYGLGLKLLSRNFRNMYMLALINSKGKLQKQVGAKAKELLVKFEQTEELRTYNYESYIDIIERYPYHNREQNLVTLFHFIPILLIREYPHKKIFLILGFVPIYKIKIKLDRTKHYLLSIVPFLKFKRK